KVKAHIAAVIALIVANLVAIVLFTMPAGMTLRATVLGAVTGFFPIGWIVLNVIFLYRLTVATGKFETLQRAIGSVTPGRRLQFLSLIVPFWLIWAFAGWRGMVAIWPAVLVTGVSFAIPQFLISNFINPWIVDIGASLISMACLIAFLQVWQPKELWLSPALRSHDDSAATMPAQPKTTTAKPSSQEVWVSMMPWIIVCAVLLVWGTGWFKAAVNPYATWNYAVPELHNMINKVPPVAATPTPEGAVFS